MREYSTWCWQSNKKSSVLQLDATHRAGSNLRGGKQRAQILILELAVLGLEEGVARRRLKQNKHAGWLKLPRLRHLPHRVFMGMLVAFAVSSLSRVREWGYIGGGSRDEQLGVFRIMALVSSQ